MPADPPPSGTPTVFVAHRAPDAAVARRIADGLFARGIRAWLDAFEIRPGDDFVAKMEDGLDQADGGVVLLSAAGLAGTWTYAEYTVLLQRVVKPEPDRPRPFLIPVLTGEHPVVPPFLRPRASLRDHELDALADAVLRHTGHRPASSAPPLGPLGGRA